MKFTTIVAATDGSPNGASSMQAAADLAAAVGCRVVAVHAFEPLALLGKVEPPVDFAVHARHARKLLENEWTVPLRAAGVTYETRVVEELPADAIVDTALEVNADLIVVGARGLNPFEELLVGSTTKTVLASAKCPVLVIPASMSS